MTVYFKWRNVTHSKVKLYPILRGSARIRIGVGVGLLFIGLACQRWNSTATIQEMRIGLGFINQAPQFSPDGQWLAFLTRFDVMGMEEVRDLAVWKWKQKESSPVKLTSGISITSYAFSPDGKFIAYIGSSQTGTRKEAGILNISTSRAERLEVSGDGAGVLWNRNGDAVFLGDTLFHRGGSSTSGAQGWVPQGRILNSCRSSQILPAGDENFLFLCQGEKNGFFVSTHDAWQFPTEISREIQEKVPIRGVDSPVSKNIALAVAQGWKTHEARFEILVLAPDIRLLTARSAGNHPVYPVGWVSEDELVFLEKENVNSVLFTWESRWNLRTGEVRRQNYLRRILDVREGMYLFTFLNQPGELYLEVKATKEVVKKLVKVNRAIFSPDGEYVVVEGMEDLRRPDTFLWVLKLPERGDII